MKSKWVASSHRVDTVSDLEHYLQKTFSQRLIAWPSRRMAQPKLIKRLLSDARQTIKIDHRKAPTGTCHDGSIAFVEYKMMQDGMNPDASSHGQTDLAGSTKRINILLYKYAF